MYTQGDNMYITVMAFENKHGAKALKLNGIVKLEKDPTNPHDAEAIACEVRHFGKIGYVANSTRSVIKGCMSGGRLYDKIADVYFARIQFISGNTAIAKVLSSDEYIDEVENPESDIHYLCENPMEIEPVKENF